jgi:hypothetical protein
MTEPKQQRNNDGVGGVVDPTKNVLDLVEAAVKRIDDLMIATSDRMEARFTSIKEQISSESEKSSALRRQQEFYETRIETLQVDHQKQIAAIIGAQTDKSAVLLSQTVDRTNERLAAVEKNQYVVGGQSSVRDPAMADAVRELSGVVRGLSSTGDKSEGRWAVIAAGIALVAGPVIGVLIAMLMK